MTTSNHFDLIVIGSGSAGSSCWYGARQTGKSVAVFEGDVLGGECPTFACVPTKALLHCADVLRTLQGAAAFGIDTGKLDFEYLRVKAWKDLVVSRTGAAQGEQPYDEMGVHLVRRHARFVSDDAVEATGERYTAERLLIATGSSQRVPSIAGLEEAGYITFREAINLRSLPESLFILGGGPSGCEFAHLFSVFGVRVTIADHNPRLMSKEEPEAGDFLGDYFTRRGLQVLTETEVVRVERAGARKRIVLKRQGREEAIETAEILIATGKTPNLDLGLEAAGIDYSDTGVAVDDTLRTTNPRVYAAGDVAGPHLFTHAASYQGGLALHNMFAADQRRVDYRAIPRCVFTSPEVAAVGLTERQAREQGIDVRTAVAGIDASDRALTCDELEGFVKVVIDRSGVLVGGVVVSARAGEVMHELALAISLGATAGQVASLVHAFPTFSESLAAACTQLA